MNWRSVFEIIRSPQAERPKVLVDPFRARPDLPAAEGAAPFVVLEQLEPLRRR
jgi:hypothetical protein